VKIGINRQRSSYVEKGCLKNHRTTAAQVTAELNIHLEDPFSAKTALHELHETNIHGKVAIAKPLITKRNAQMRKRWRHGHIT
jgi:hypothetical protein